MPSTNIVAYEGFAYISIITILGCLLARKLYSLKEASAPAHVNQLHEFHAGLSLSAALIYISVGVAFLVETVLYGDSWADWCWRWALLGGLLDSVCAIRAAKRNNQDQLFYYLQSVVAAVEVMLIGTSSAFPFPSGARYLTFGAILSHSLWTAASAAFWEPSVGRSIRVSASFLELLASIASIWSPIVLVILFCSCSVVIYIEELQKTQQPLLPIALVTMFRNNLSANDNRHTYEIVFLGQGERRGQAYRHVLGPAVADIVQGEAKETCKYPGREDTAVLSIQPQISINDAGVASLNRIISGATAVVVVMNICSEDSVDYVRGLRGFPEGQPGLLVAYQTDYPDEMFIGEHHAEHMAVQRGWEFTMSINLDMAFGHLVDRMFARPPPSGEALEPS